MRRSDGAFATRDEMEATIQRLRLELDAKDDKIARLNREIDDMRARLGSECIVLPSQLTPERLRVLELDEFAKGLPV